MAPSSYDVKLPDIGEGVAEGEIVRWLVKAGEAVKEDQPLVEVMTDKASVEIPSPRTGTIEAILVEEGAVVPVAMEAAEQAAARGWSAEVLDLRTLLPLDADAVLASVRRTGRAVIVHEAPRTCGYGAELSALLAEQALTSLQAPVLRVTGYDTPFPYTLEHTYLPDARRVFAALERVMEY